MFDSQWLDVAIGVVFVWFLFSLVLSFLSEATQRLLALRSKQLWLALNQLLDGKFKPRALWTSTFRLLTFGGRPKATSPGSLFTQKVYATASIQGVENRATDKKKTRISDIPSEVFSQALVEMGVRDTPNGKTPLQHLEALAADTPFADQVKAFAASADSSLEKFREQVEGWFDGQMTRLSAAYKAKMRYLFVPVGIILAFVGFGLGMRTDALALVSDVQHDQNLRSTLVTSADTAVRDNLVTKGCPGETQKAKDKRDQQPAECATRGAAKLSNIDLAIYSSRDKEEDLSNWRVVLGVLITGLAISLGSTFWYDILKRLVGLRSQRAAGS